jgi:hypothetical protein
MKRFKRAIARLLGIRNISLIPVVDEIGKAFKKGLEEGMKKDDCTLKVVISVDSKHVASSIVEEINRLQDKKIKDKSMFY